MEHIKFHICALESAPRGVLADFLKARPDVACEIFRGMSGPYSVMIKGEKETGEVVMALHDSEILTQAGLYLADFAEHHDNIVVSPHMAGQTREAASGVATLAAEGTVAVINGEKWDKVCNPKAYDHARWQK